MITQGRRGRREAEVRQMSRTSPIFKKTDPVNESLELSGLARARKRRPIKDAQRAARPGVIKTAGRVDRREVPSAEGKRDHWLVNALDSRLPRPRKREPAGQDWLLRRPCCWHACFARGDARAISAFTFNQAEWLEPIWSSSTPRGD